MPSCGADMDERSDIALCGSCGADNTDEAGAEAAPAIDYEAADRERVTCPGCGGRWHGPGRCIWEDVDA